ncbi:MAG TPA: DUF2786 domain-containing protein [Nocardioidaceae bacterium]|nr:DUF2786 domain-containing protein [Nocardioidaceae bacterium]
MGVNNKQRRAAKKRKQGRSRPAPSRPAGRDGSGWGPGAWGERDPFADQGWEDPDRTGEERSDEDRARSHHRSRALVLRWVGELAAGRMQPEELSGLLSAEPSGARGLGAAAAAVCDELVVNGLENGWSPVDLVEAVRRRGSARQLPALAAMLTEHLAGRPQTDVPAWWRRELNGVGTPRAADPTTVQGITTLLSLAAAVHDLPPVPPALSSGEADGDVEDTADLEHAKALRRVRSLLAKAESTEFDEEAEALSAKAQELISRHSLERLLRRADADAHGGNGSSAVLARRIWLDAPYVVAKAMVVQTVAQANRCRSVLIKDLEVCTLVGSPEDLDAVELLSTSLLVQADRAMLRHGRQVDFTGTSRTRSFRQSFLVSYASRIGERLREADQAMTDRATHDEVERARLLPALRDQEQRVADALREAFPGLVQHRTQVTNRQGWAAGRAAADLARLDVRRRVERG